ncbi:MAG TPA: ABC transporter permease [Bryobacteraceae bacterium]|nr:ABC transporter permease [Bryobacteraceae bacterium]
MLYLFRNLRYAGRQWRRLPEHTIIAVISLALGIGANTAMFTVVESVLLRPLPYADPDRLVDVRSAGGTPTPAVSWLDYVDIRDRSRSLAAVAAYSTDAGVIQIKGASIGVVTSAVTPNVFSLLGVQPLRGRTFTKEEAQPNGPAAVMVSEELWRQSLAADPRVVGSAVRVNGHDRTVVGVMPRGFAFPESAGREIEKGIWLPMQTTPEMLQERGADFFAILARRAPGFGLSQTQAELALIAKHIRENDSRADRQLGFRAQSYHEAVTGSVREVFLGLFAAVGLVLLVGCANVANLLIARGLGRQYEFALRAALGAGTRRLIGQVIAEASLLSACGCGLGYLLVCWIIRAVHRLPPDIIPRAESIEVHWTVLLALGGLATATTILSALLPALLAARVNPQTVLRTASRSVNTRSLSTTACIWLAGGEVALSVVLLIATGLLFRTLWDLEHTRLGFDTTNVTSFVAMPADALGFGNASANATAGPTASVATTVYYPLLEAMRHAPGVQRAALVTAPPFSGFVLQTNFNVIGRRAERPGGFSVRLSAVSGEFGELMATPVMRGRGITEQDTESAPYVAVINETLANRYFAGKEPLGQWLDLGGEATGMLRPYIIVGIMGDQVDSSVSQPPEPLLMLSYRQIPPSSVYYAALLKTAVHFVLKTRGNVAAAPAVRAIFRSKEPDLALDDFQTMQEAVHRSNFGSRLGLDLIAAFAGLAVLMVITGLYGVLSQVATLRSREFGLRMALGATRQRVVRMVLLRGSRIVAAGLSIGILLSFLTRRLIASFLYGVKPLDIRTYSFAVVALLTIGLGAALIPAWRAASGEPLKALRDE